MAAPACDALPDAPPAGAVPPGWDHNPTSLSRRALLSLLAAAGLAIALYLTLFQLGAFDTVWDPWFESRKVLELTEPVPDALAGVLAYGAELLLLALGGRDRWRSLPWVCLALGLTLATGGAVSIALIVIQPTVAAAWCTLCLASACLSLSLLALGFGEARAAWQHVRRARTRGVAFGDAFWGRAAAVPLRGGESPEVQAVDVRSGSSLVVAALLLASWLARPRRPAGR